ncbi:MAG: hypothetical protein ACKVOB_03845 [Sphingomonas sp.]
MIRAAGGGAAAPKYAHVERERRWLVDPARRPALAGLPPVLIDDRYFTGTRLRLRRMTDASGACALKLTKKYDAADPLARPIVTAYLTEAEYAVFAALPAAILVKRRYALVDSGVRFSLDVFGGGLAPLELCEIEWADDAGLRALQPPDWAVREVSSDPRYQGSALAMNGAPQER